MTYRSEKLLKVVRNFPCTNCGAEDGTVCAAHSNQSRDGKGMGIKAADYRIAALCFKCHGQIDQGSKLSQEDRVRIWEDAHRKTVGLLFEGGFLKVN